MELKNYQNILELANRYNATLVVVTKNQSIEDVQSLIEAGHNVFAENKVQEILNKKDILSSDIEWHMIGSLQRNKVKLIAPWIDMIQSVDSFDLAQKINIEARSNNRIVSILLEMKIAQEDNKHGFFENDLITSLYRDNWDAFQHLNICGLMGMGSLTSDKDQIRNEFRKLKSVFNLLKSNYFNNIEFKELSFGMSSDYEMALAEGSTIIRVGSKIFQA